MMWPDRIKWPVQFVPKPLGKAQVASDISRGSQTALFTPADLAIANQLKGIYGACSAAAGCCRDPR